MHRALLCAWPWADPSRGLSHVIVIPFEMGASKKTPRPRKFPEWSMVIRASSQRSQDQTRPDASPRSAHCAVTASRGSRRKHLVAWQEARRPAPGCRPADSSWPPWPAELQVKCSGHFSAPQELSAWPRRQPPFLSPPRLRASSPWLEKAVILTLGS